MQNYRNRKNSACRKWKDYEGQLYPCFPITKSLFYAGEYGLIEFSDELEEGKVLKVQGAWRLEYIKQV
ncbi:hypothetical protein CHH49_00730 [Terribacillus saccharophilus]|nr:hypothetical protein CHH49_00730 [Terribacillus saccharophilus]